MLLNGPIRIEKYIVTLSLLYKVHLITMLYKVEKILKGCQNSISSPSPSLKIQIIGEKVCFKCKGKYWWVLSTNFWIQKVCWQCPAMFCLYTSRKLSRPLSEFSMKVKVMRSNPGYLLKFSLLCRSLVGIEMIGGIQQILLVPISFCPIIWLKNQLFLIEDASNVVEWLDLLGSTK